MGRITEALKKVTDEQMKKIQKIPETRYVSKKVRGTSIEEHIVAFHDPASLVSEQYNILRTNIQRLKDSRYYRTFLITSSIDTEGKTVTSVNLAMAMAREINDRSVLLIDADMRKGRTAKYLGLPLYPGLAELLSDKAAADEVIMNPGIGRLAVITSGKVPKNPSDLLNSAKMRHLLSVFKTEYDYILIDTPPVMLLTDACILGPMADAAILVVQAGRTQRDMIKHAETRLAQSGVKIAGFVMTKLKSHLPDYLSRYMRRYGGGYAYHPYKKQPAEKQEVTTT